MRSILPGVLTLALLPAAMAQSSLDWTSYLSGDRSGSVAGVAIGPDGGIWVAGTSATQFDSPGPNVPYQLTHAGGTDVFVAKYRRDPGGAVTLEFWTWIGGSGNEQARALTLDSLGRVYITGTTDSLIYPSEGYFTTTQNAGGIDCFIAVIDPQFSGKESMVHNNLWGAAGTDIPNAIAVDPAFNVYIAGYTTSVDIPGRNSPAQNNGRGGWEGFMVRFDPSNPTPLRYATYIGGNSTDVVTGVAVAANGTVWLSGYTASSDFFFDQSPASGIDGFLVGLDLNRGGLDAIVYESYVGGNGADYPKALQIGADGTLWITGYTFSNDFTPSPNAIQSRFSGVADGYVMGIDTRRPRGQGMVYFTYLGGSDADVPQSLTVLANGRLAVSGYTNSREFPTAGGPLQQKNGNSADAFVTIFNPASAGSEGALEYSTFIGGGLNDVATGATVDGNGVYVAGYTNSVDFPSTGGGRNPNPSVNTGYLMRISR